MTTLLRIDVQFDLSDRRFGARDVLPECRGVATGSLHSGGGQCVGAFEQSTGSGDGADRESGGDGGAVDQAETVPGTQLQRREARGRAVEQLSLADQGQRRVCAGYQIATGRQGTRGGDGRGKAGVQRGLE